MKIDRIINSLEKKNYKVTRSMSGTILVKHPNGFTKMFNSYNEAYRYYFS